MRHDPAGAAIVIMLRSLKMYGMSQAVTDLMEQGSPAFDAAQPMLAQLLKAEMAEREVRSIAYHMKVARFPAYKDLSGFDFASSEVNEAPGPPAAPLRIPRWCSQYRPDRRAGNGEKPYCHRHRRSGHRAPPQEGPLLLNR